MTKQIEPVYHVLSVSDAYIFRTTNPIYLDELVVYVGVHVMNAIKENASISKFIVDIKKSTKFLPLLDTGLTFFDVPFVGALKYPTPYVHTKLLYDASTLITVTDKYSLAVNYKKSIVSVIIFDDASTTFVKTKFDSLKTLVNFLRQHMPMFCNRSQTNSSSGVPTSKANTSVVNKTTKPTQYNNPLNSIILGNLNQ